MFAFIGGYQQGYPQVMCIVAGLLRASVAKTNLLSKTGQRICTQAAEDITQTHKLREETAKVEATIRGLNIDVTPALGEYVRRRLHKLSRLLEGSEQVHVKLSVEKNRHTVEVTVHLHGWLARAEDTTDDMYTAIDAVVDKLETQARRYLHRIPRHARLPVPETASMPADDSVARVKHFSSKPIAVDEAIARLNLIGHDFYVFRNQETDSVSVIYRRKRGGYGLLVQED